MEQKTLTLEQSKSIVAQALDNGNLKIDDASYKDTVLIVQALQILINTNKDADTKPKRDKK